MSWEKAHVIVATLKDGFVSIAAIVLPIVVFVIGNNINEAVKDKEIKLKTVELAITILQQTPAAGHKEAPRLREWAMDVVDNYSGIPLPPDAREELLFSPLPEFKWGHWSKGFENFAIKPSHQWVITPDGKSQLVPIEELPSQPDTE